MKIAVIAALSQERAQLEQLIVNPISCQNGLFTCVQGTIGVHSITIMQSGIGKVNAAIGTHNIVCSIHPDAVINTGVAGGVSGAVEVMDVVAATEVVYHDVWCGPGNAVGQIQDMPPRFTCNPTLVQTAYALKGRTSVRCGLICTGDKFITSQTDMQTIRNNFPKMLSVDMESAAIAHVCWMYNVPFISFRIISDTPGVQSHWQQYQDFWTTLAQRSFDVVRSFLEHIPQNL